MKERPIIFQGDMVRAILEGRKTQMRCLLKTQPEHWITAFQPTRKPNVWEGYGKFPSAAMKGLTGEDFKCLYGQPGERLWVKETWTTTGYNNCDEEGNGYVYRASENGKLFEDTMIGWKWQTSIHMPREASRITLEITNIRVERLQDITNEDAIAQGCHSRGDYRNLWDKINGKGAWAANPWVWVLEFKRLNL